MAICFTTRALRCMHTTAHRTAPSILSATSYLTTADATIAVAASRVAGVRASTSNRQVHTSAQATSSTLLQSIARDAAALQELHAYLSSDMNALAAYERTATLLAACATRNNSVFTTGIGKSGIVAQRFASSLASISVPSRWIHASEWTHGELGNLRQGDTVVVVSHSGATRELLALPALVHARGCSVVTLTGATNALLCKQSDVTLVAPASDDVACPVPSRSIVVQEAVCNALVAQLVVQLNERAACFARNHPGGAIGSSNFDKRL